MKILGVSCSPRKKGNTITLLKKMLKGASELGSEIELFSVSGKTFKGCDGYYTCFSEGKCHIQDDMQPLYEKMIEADGIVFGTPIYIYGMTVQAKAIMDRTYALDQKEKKLVNKVGGVIVTAGGLDFINALKDFYFFFALQRMLPANFVAAYATIRGSTKKLENSMKASFALGKEMVQLVNKNFDYPEEFPRNFLAFTTHTR